MSAALAVLSAVAALGGLPQLPERGLALDTRAGVQLQTMGGKPIATLPGLDLASDKTVAHNLTMRDRRGRIFILERDGRVRRVDEGRPEYPGCRVNDARRTLLLL